MARGVSHGHHRLDRSRQNTTVVFAVLMTTSAELGSSIAREKAAASTVPLPAADRLLLPAAVASGSAAG
jgi:hypothetical protein